MAAVACPLHAESWEGTPLSSMLEALRRSGIEVLYSSALVPDDLLITPEPPGATLLERTTAALRASGLELRPLTPGHYVVNRAAGNGTGAALAGNLASNGGTAQPPALDSITIFASRYAFADGVEGSINELSSGQITDVPTAATDVVKAARIVPGTATSDDVRPHIRGSPQDDVLVLFDHVPIADPYHLQSFQRLMSAFDTSVVGGMNVYSGGFPARFGARSGGVIDIRPRTADGADEYSVSAGTVTQRISALGRADDIPVEWLGALRRSAPRYNVESFIHNFDQPTLLDGVARLQWRPTASTSWTAGVLSMDDSVHFDADVAEEDVRARYRDFYAWLSIESIPAGGWQSRTGVSFMHSEHMRDGTVARPEIVNGSLTERRDFEGVEAASEWVRDFQQRTRLDLGAQIGRMSGENDYRRSAFYSAAAAETFSLSATQALFTASEPREFYYSAHGSVRVRPGDRLEAEAGLRLDGQTYFAGHDRYQISPRLNVRYRSSPQVSLYASWGRYSQDQRPNEWRLEENQQVPDPVQTSTQTIVGISRDISPAVAVRVEWYRNRWTHVHPYFDNLLSTQSLLADLTPDRVRLAPSGAEADGVEISARGILGSSCHYWASYARSRVVDEMAAGDVPRSWDQRSAINAGLGWRHGPYAVSGVLMYHSGWARTPFAVIAPAAAQSSWFELGARNSGNWPDYVSADLRTSWSKPVRSAQVEIFAEVTNLANRGNPSSAALTIADPGMPVTPSSGYWMPRQFQAGVTWTLR